MTTIPRNKSTTKREAKLRETAHQNWMGGTSWNIDDPIVRLKVIAASCFFGEPMYYNDASAEKTTRSHVTSRSTRSVSATHQKHLDDTLGDVGLSSLRSISPIESMESAIDAALTYDAKATLEVAVELRHSDNIRTTPQVILVRAAHHDVVRGTGLVRAYGPKIIHRADEPGVCLAYHFWRYKDRPVPNSLKKALAARLVEFDEYSIAKYRKLGPMKLVDVVNIVHPRATSAISKLMKGELTTTDITWESKVSASGSTKESWEESIDVMGHMALLRNLRNFSVKGVDPAKYVPKLVKTARGGKQLPFRYYSAYKSLGDGADAKVLDAIEECMDISLENVPHFAGRTMSLCDNSGSAQGTMTSSMGSTRIADIANLTALITAKSSDDGHVGVFGDALKTFSIRKMSSIFDDLKTVTQAAATIGQSTEHGIWLFWDQAIRNKEHWDSVFVYSDMQAGHGGLYGVGTGAVYKKYTWPGSGHYIDVAKLIADYRRQVNPNVMVYLVQVAGYKDALVPETYDRTFILGGWSNTLLNYADRMRTIFEQNNK